MKIKSRGGGYHFMACYFKDEKLYLSDTSNRGIGVFAEDVVTKKQFMWYVFTAARLINQGFVTLKK
jgi:hypothetical protein